MILAVDDYFENRRKFLWIYRRKTFNQSLRMCSSFFSFFVWKWLEMRHSRQRLAYEYVEYFALYPMAVMAKFSQHQKKYECHENFIYIETKK